MQIRARKKRTNKQTAADRRLLAKAEREERGDVGPAIRRAAKRAGVEPKPAETGGNMDGAIDVLSTFGPLYEEVARLGDRFDAPGAGPREMAMARALVVLAVTAVHSDTILEVYQHAGRCLLDMSQEIFMARIGDATDARKDAVQS